MWYDSLNIHNKYFSAIILTDKELEIYFWYFAILNSHILYDILK